MTSRCVYAAIVVLVLLRSSWAHTQVAVEITEPQAPPTWALLERHLLDEHTAACREFFQKYFDERGYLLCVERWGGDDGPDDAIENVNDWPILHALGGDPDILRMYKRAWEGHLWQYTNAKTTHVPFARDGMYYKEFPVMMDWVHNGEGLTVFNLQGLSDPYDAKFRKRTRRFAGFYLNEDPGAPNYDPQHKIIRSLFNGSRGPLMRRATAVDWAGDPIEVKNRFRLRHGEESYEQMLAHFEDYNDIVGDHPQNLLATNLAMNAYMLSGEPKYRDWILEYVEAWRQRAIDNQGIIPTNIGIDGRPGGNADGKWYGGVYGWSFTVTVPQDGSLAHRNTHHLGFWGFANAYVLSGDDRFLDVWRRQTHKINSLGKVINGRMHWPTMYGAQGWYHYVPNKYTRGALQLYTLSQQPQDRVLVADNPWLQFLAGDNPGFPELALRADLDRLRSTVKAIREDTSTPDTRLADDPMHLNPASVSSLIQLTLGGIHPQRVGAILTCNLRYFDPHARRAGLPPDVAALVRQASSSRVVVELVNTNQLEPRSVVLQAGGYGEHQFESVTYGAQQSEVQANHLLVTLRPGAGGVLQFSVRRHVNQPRLEFPPPLKP